MCGTPSHGDDMDSNVGTPIGSRGNKKDSDDDDEDHSDQEMEEQPDSGEEVSDNIQKLMLEIGHIIPSMWPSG